MSQKVRSGACNVCAAPCSSCMHFAADMEFSGDTSAVLDDASTTIVKPQSDAMEDTDESDIVEHDVKVCDICGDAGREDMLAICSRCTDGAEHTYCMRKMLRKIPANNWMCEECKFADEKQGVEAKRVTKRVPENEEVVAPTLKRQAVETSNSVKPISLSRESSFKTLDKDRLRPPQQSTSDVQTHKGMLMKSKSFNASNSKPKVKLVDEVPVHKQKGTKDHTSVDAKERSRLLQKSLSLKSANLGRPSAPDSKVKMLSPRISHTLDSKGSRSVKERQFDRKTLSKLDRPLSSSTSSSTVSASKPDLTSRTESTSTRDLKGQAEGKLSTSKATTTRRPAEPFISSVGNSSAATELKLNDDASFSTEKPFNSNNVDGTTADGLARTQETSMRSRSSVMSTSKSTFCQKCKEIGHSAELCSSGSSEASGVESSVPTPRSFREEIHKGSKLKDAIHAALLRKPEIHRKKRPPDQVDETSTSTTDLNSEIPMILNKPNVTLPVPRNCTLGSTQSSVNTMIPIAEAKSCSIKPVVNDVAALPQLLKMLSIPEYDYIWRGCFEVNRSGNSLEFCGGIQAHLSSCVSPRVPEVARKFPQKLSLNEVPRLSAWPTQFHDGGAKEDNIALYFFAKDLESYERSYKSLLDGMMKNDLALKGNFEGVELLIFPSNQLPENSQRWNMLYFLWGVFRARRVSNPESSSNSGVPNDRTGPLDIKAAKNVMTTSENLSLPKFEDAESSGCDNSCPEISGHCSHPKYSEPLSSGLKASTVMRYSRIDTKSASDANKTDNTRCTSPLLLGKSPLDAKVEAEVKPSLLGGGVSRCNIGEKAQLCIDSKDLKEMVGVKNENNSGYVKREEAEVRSEGICKDGMKKTKRESDGWKSKEEEVVVSECLLFEKKVCMDNKMEEECEEKVIGEDLGSKKATEMRFFPIDTPWNNNKINHHQQQQNYQPNLELALGAETKPTQNKGMLPFLVGLGNRKDDEKEEEEEEVSASLSLSLSFSNNEKRRRQQQQDDEKEAQAQAQRAKTSLLLFK